MSTPHKTPRLEGYDDSVEFQFSECPSPTPPSTMSESASGGGSSFPEMVISDDGPDVVDAEDRDARGSDTLPSSSSCGGSPTRGGAAGPAPIITRPQVRTAGLVNEGCTCYLNSLLQMLFHLTCLRSAVYRIPENNKPSVEKALQELFFEMQERTTPVHTKKLTDAFGWGEQELYVQHDIQEMATLLRDNLEECMKGTVTEGAISQLFEGTGEQFVETLDKSFISRRKDVFYDIHIPLGEHTNLLDCLSSLTVRDQLIGDNKYKVEVEGQPPVYKEATKGYAFKKFPPVTWFHLKRFAMDLYSPTLEMKKVNSRMEFPAVLDLTSLEEGLTQEERLEAASRTKRGAAVEPFSLDSPAIYDLQGVIVHRGTVRSGHYYCYIREWDHAKQSFTNWVEFEDENVNVVADPVAVTANYGLSASESGRGRYDRSCAPMRNANAYILSYVRRADTPTILAPSPTDIISQRVKDAMLREVEEEARRRQLEQERKERLTLYVVTDASLAAYCMVHQVDLLARDTRTFRNYADGVLELRKSDSIGAAYEAVAANAQLSSRGITADNCRLWRWGGSYSYRPVDPLPTWSDCQLMPKRFSEFLNPAEMEKPFPMCVYLQEAVPPLKHLPAAADVVPLVHTLLHEDRGTCTVTLREPTSLRGLSLLLEGGACYATHCQVQAVITTDTKVLPKIALSCPVRDGVMAISLCPQVLTLSVQVTCTAVVDVVSIRDVRVTVAPGVLRCTRSLSKPELSARGADRVFLFFKFFDYQMCTVRYLGSAFVELGATLADCTALLMNFMGFGDDASPDMELRYYEEIKGTITRELPPQKELVHTSLFTGSIVVVQCADVPLAFTCCRVESHYRSLGMNYEVRALEVEAKLLENETLYRSALADPARIAAARQLTSPTDDVCTNAVSTDEEKSTASDLATPTTAAPSHAAPASQRPTSILLNPYSTTLPVLRQVSLCVVGEEIIRLPATVSYEAVCEDIARTVITADPNRLRLYRNAHVTEPHPMDRPVRCVDGMTLEDILSIDRFIATPIVYYERLDIPRTLAEQCYTLVVTLRDAAGYAQHCERYVLPPRATMQELVRRVRQSVTPWEHSMDAFGSLSQTVAAPHYILVSYDPSRGLLHHIFEVSMEVPDEAESRLSSSLAELELFVQPMAPLQPTEQRIALCHGEYMATDVAHTYGIPCVLTITLQTTVRMALQLALRSTRVPYESLTPQSTTGINYRLMMLTQAPLHFEDWDQLLHLYWQHTQNTSGIGHNLMLNHPKPREKPGSRYVAQHSPKLKISGRTATS